jgi:Host cell surface-exposed lipoprotein
LTRRRCWTAMLLLVLAVAATGCGGKSGDSGTGSSVSTSERSDEDSGTGSSVSMSERLGGGDPTAKRTPSLQSAFDAARYYLDTESLSRSALVQRMGMGVGETYSEAEALYAVNHVDADWKAEAVEDAKNHLEDQGLSKNFLMWYLTEADGFSKAEATYAVSRIGRDWNAEAVEVVKEILEAEALSKSQLIRRLKRGGFTDAQVRYAVEKVY